jgi:hypothetical protein
MTGSAEPTSPTIVPFDDRARRVIELREQVRAGAYRPDPREVARAILAHTEHTEHTEHGEVAGTAPPLDHQSAEATFTPSRYIVPRSRPARPNPAASRAIS